MLTTLGTLALLATAVAVISELLHRDAAKIAAALMGRSWASDPLAGRPVTIRFSQAGRGAARTPAQAALRAAA